MVTFCIFGIIMALIAVLIGILPVLFIVSAIGAAIFVLVIAGFTVGAASLVVLDFAIGVGIVYLIIKGIRCLCKK